MKAIVCSIAIAAACSITGCGSTASDADFLGGIPDGESLRIKLPGASAAKAALTAESQGVLTKSQVGDYGEFYVFTRQMTQEVNNAVYGLLLMIEDVAQQEPTTKEADRWIWGPYTPGGLDPASYKVTISRTGDKDYAWSLEEKARDAADDAFAQVMGGTHTKGTRARRGAGTIALDFDAMAALDPSKVERGKADVTYQTDTYPVTVTVAFKDFVGDDGKGPADSTYRYTENEGGSGEFSFAVTGDIDAKGKDEDVGILSRWEADGRGRADVRITGGDLVDQQITDVTAVECWDAGFKRTYFEDWATAAQGKVPLDALQGEAASCAFTGQKLP